MARDCDAPVEDAVLEGVPTCDYFLQHRDVPPPGTRVALRGEPLEGRPAVETGDGAAVGFLPPSLHSLLECAARGWEYRGEVLESAVHTVPHVVVRLRPSRKRG